MHYRLVLSHFSFQHSYNKYLIYTGALCFSENVPWTYIDMVALEFQRRSVILMLNLVQDT